MQWLRASVIVGICRKSIGRFRIGRAHRAKVGAIKHRPPTSRTDNHRDYQSTPRRLNPLWLMGNLDRKSSGSLTNYRICQQKRDSNHGTPTWNSIVMTVCPSEELHGTHANTSRSVRNMSWPCQNLFCEESRNNVWTC